MLCQGKCIDSPLFALYQCFFFNILNMLFFVLHVCKWSFNLNKLRLFYDWYQMIIKCNDSIYKSVGFRKRSNNLDALCEWYIEYLIKVLKFTHEFMTYT